MCEISESRFEMKIDINDEISKNENERSSSEKSSSDSSNTEDWNQKGFKKGRNFILTVNEKCLSDYEKIIKYLKSTYKNNI